MSLLGNYETASVYYQGVVQQVWSNSYEVSNFSQLYRIKLRISDINNLQIHRLLGSIDDPVRKMKWQQIQGEVKKNHFLTRNQVRWWNNWNHEDVPPDIIKSNKRLIAVPKVPAKARISRHKCHLRQNSVNCDKCHNLRQNSTICIKTSQFA